MGNVTIREKIENLNELWWRLDQMGGGMGTSLKDLYESMADKIEPEAAPVEVAPAATADSQ